MHPTVDASHIPSRSHGPSCIPMIHCCDTDDTTTNDTLLAGFVAMTIGTLNLTDMVDARNRTHCNALEIATVSRVIWH